MDTRNDSDSAWPHNPYYADLYVVGKQEEPMTPHLENITTGFLVGFAFYYGYLIAAYIAARIDRTIGDLLGDG